MRQRGWTQRDLSMASGISQRQISNLVKGTQSAALDTAEAIAQAFDMKTWHMLIRTTGLPPKDLARLRRVIAAFLDGPVPGPDGPAANYLQMFRYNTRTLITALTS